MTCVGSFTVIPEIMIQSVSHSFVSIYFAFRHPSFTVAQDQDLFTPQSILQKGDFNVNFYSTFGGQSRICISFMEVHDFHFYWTGRTKADYVKYLVLLLN